MVPLLKHINKSDIHRGRRCVRVEGKETSKINEVEALENCEGENRGGETRETGRKKKTQPIKPKKTKYHQQTLSGKKHKN